MKKLNELFVITYGNKFDLNKMEIAKNGVNFVGRSGKNQGVSAKVSLVNGLSPYDAGLITVALGGTKLLSSFIQEKPFYTAQNVAVLTPKEDMTFAEKLYICLCIRHNRFRYCAFGREANRTLKDILIPEKKNYPDWLKTQECDIVSSFSRSKINKKLPLSSSWKSFELQELFDIERGRGPRKKELDGTGAVPFITSSDSNNGLTGYTSHKPCHKGNTIGVNRNGSVGEAFYQPTPFCSTEDVHIFNPKFEMNPYIALFLTTLIRLEKYRFGYGRKWGIERMKKSIIQLPVTKTGKPDWDYMGNYIKSLSYSSQI